MRSQTTRRKRPPAAALAKELRSALGDRRRVVQRVHVDVTRTSLAERGLPAAAAFVATLAGAMMLPFFPAFWAPAFALAVGGLTLRAPRAGLALALAAPILPLGNVALGLALRLRRDRHRLARSVRGETRARARVPGGPLLAPLGLIALVPLAVQPVKGHVRRGAQALAAVAVAALVAGLRGSDLPFGQGAPAEARRWRNRERCRHDDRVARAVPLGLVLGGFAALAAIALAVPYARTPWRIAGLGAGALALTIFAVPTAPALPLVVAIWLTCVGLGLRAEH